MSLSHPPRPQPPYPLDTPSDGTLMPDENHHRSWRTGTHTKLERKDIYTSGPYTFLSYFDTVFLIDDSAAMVEHWDAVGKLLGQISGVCAEHDRNGIDMYFVNHRPRGYYLYATIGRKKERGGYFNIGKTAGDACDNCDNVAGIFRAVRPHGGCRLDHRLSAILDPYMEEYIRRVKDGVQQAENLRPLNLIVITAGVTDDNPYDTLIETARKLDFYHAPPYQVGIQFFRVGDDDDGRRAMDFADHGLAQTLNLRDMVDTVTWTSEPGELAPDAVLKVVLGAVERSIDKPV
ncbi:uncharacterized protein GGS22DRAFT_93428 [Annulohypoxylon maeteangense]|uniref:uncharacterized protein n=1 Tax=Annulohypoxylon maeteangense TaxID=1927788 RepID=UPI0020084854|nr:uncharacterized protein GGS22DRAFT_93428 [Annulohypoxylon maeteangense]KAI0888121.1 hypothetical protein GGS22DRAFT_93428 [Annulohypoxylon maeteangense]